MLISMTLPACLGNVLTPTSGPILHWAFLKQRCPKMGLMDGMLTGQQSNLEVGGLSLVLLMTGWTMPVYIQDPRLFNVMKVYMASNLLYKVTMF